MAGDSLERLQSSIGYRFRNRRILLEALTHSSHAQESSSPTRDNEQLEFLGDAIINFLVSVRLADTFPEYEEGKLSRGRARLVGASHLAAVAGRMKLGEFFRLGGGGEKTGGRSQAPPLCHGLVALLAPPYLHCGLA